MTEDELVGWHHRLDGHEFEWTLGVGMDREACRAAVHGVTESWTRLSDWTELNHLVVFLCILCLKHPCLKSFHDNFDMHIPGNLPLTVPSSKSSSFQASSHTCFWCTALSSMRLLYSNSLFRIGLIALFLFLLPDIWSLTFIWCPLKTQKGI